VLPIRSGQVHGNTATAETVPMALRPLIADHATTVLPLAGAVIGSVFGALLRASNFCTMGAVSDWRMTGDKGRLGAVALAAATAIVGAQTLDTMGVSDLSQSIYLNPRLNWLGALAGGLLFGYGMVYAGGCPSRALVRTGGGDVRAGLTLIVMAIAAYAALSGVFGEARVLLESATAIDLNRQAFATQGLPTFVAAHIPDAAYGETLTIAAVVLALLALAAAAKVQSRWSNVVGGLGVGLLVTAAWAVTGLAYDEMTVRPLPPQALSFVRPVADAIDWLERATALGWPGFGTATVFGTLAGSFGVAWWQGTLRYDGFADKADLKRHLLGAAAMGCGGILALGCSIGQGISGLSTLSVQSIIAAVAILAGAVVALHQLQKSI
jgi:uncharacterized protein